MKETILDTNCKPCRARSRRGRNAALMAAVAICACTAVRLDAEVIDDFEDPTRSATLWQAGPWNGTGTNTFSDGHVTLEVTPPAGQGAFYNFLLSDRTWKIQEGRTLEFRADLLSSNDDGALAWFGFYLNDGNRGYMLVVDEDTVAFIKRESPGQAFFQTNGIPMKVSNVKLVVSMTGTNSSVLLKVKILDNDNAGAVLFERECWDTPAADPMHTDPLHPEWGVDNPPASYLGLNGYFLMCLFRDPALVDPVVTLPSGAKAEVVYDNAEVFEYYPPHLEIAQVTNDIGLEWRLPLQEHIVVQADQLAGPWCPCWQPCTQTTNDVFCLNMPYESPQQFFKLTPGRQFTDDFSTLVPTWMDWFKEPGEEWVITNGILNVSISPTPYGGLVLCPLGATNVEAVLQDFCASVDILDWATSGTNWSVVTLFGRGLIISPSEGTGYFAGLSLNSGGNPGLVAPWILVPERGYLDGEPFYIHEIPPPYRLQFSVVGTNLSLRVLRPATGQPIREMSWSGWELTNGVVGLWFNGRNNAGDYYTNTVDNFFLSGTKH